MVLVRFEPIETVQVCNLYISRDIAILMNDFLP